MGATKHIHPYFRLKNALLLAYLIVSMDAMKRKNTMVLAMHLAHSGKSSGLFKFVLRSMTCNIILKLTYFTRTQCFV